MPCFSDIDSDGGNNVVLTHDQWVDTEKAAAGLCALISTLEKMGNIEDILSNVDWNLAGITKNEFRNWWTHHRREDEYRRAREEEARIRSEKIRAARSKLSLEEQVLLGLK